MAWPGPLRSSVSAHANNLPPWPSQWHTGMIMTASQFNNYLNARQIQALLGAVLVMANSKQQAQLWHYREQFRIGIATDEGSIVRWFIIPNAVGLRLIREHWVTRSLPPVAREPADVYDLAVHGWPE